MAMVLNSCLELGPNYNSLDSFYPEGLFFSGSLLLRLVSGRP
jgi:hypothetical protein